MRATSKLRPGVKRHRDDGQVLEALASLPHPQDTQWDLPQLAGVANEGGEVYRTIMVASTFELVQLTARLNALGFSVSSELRHARVRPYDRIFVKRSRS